MALYNVRQESIPRFVDALGRKKVIASLSKEELMAALSKEEHLAALSKEDILSAVREKEDLLKSLLAELKPEQLQKLLAEIGRN